MSGFTIQWSSSGLMSIGDGKGFDRRELERHVKVVGVEIYTESGKVLYSYWPYRKWMPRKLPIDGWSYYRRYRARRRRR